MHTSNFISFSVLIFVIVQLANSVASASETSLAFPGAGEQESGWTALPSGRPLRPLLTDPLDLKMGLRKNSRRELEADVGYYRSFAGWKGEIAGRESTFHTGLEGNGYFNLRRQDSKFPLNSSDGLIGLYAEATRGVGIWQLRYTHISAHLSDGLYDQRTRIVYTRETLSLRYAQQWHWLRGYVGYHFLTHTEPSFPRHSAQVGGYAVFPVALRPNFFPYLGFDEKIRNSREGSTLTLSAGLMLVSEHDMPPLRLSCNYLTGHDLRGQFYSERRKKFAVGLDMDL